MFVIQNTPDMLYYFRWRSGSCLLLCIRCLNWQVAINGPTRHGPLCDEQELAPQPRPRSEWLHSLISSPQRRFAPQRSLPRRVPSRGPTMYVEWSDPRSHTCAVSVGVF